MCLPPRNFIYPFSLELSEGAQMYTFPQSLYEMKSQLGQQLAHAQTFDCVYVLRPLSTRRLCLREAKIRRKKLERFLFRGEIFASQSRC